MTDVDLYEVLGVRRDATDDELKRAYRAKAREFHPDANQGDAGRRRAVQRGQPGLRGPEGSRAAGPLRPLRPRGGVRRRRRWRRRPGTRSAAGLGDLFDAFFNGMGGAGAGGRGRRTGPMPGPGCRDGPAPDLPGGGVRGARARSRWRRRSTATPARARGARPGTSAVRCPECQGAGELRRVRQSILGQVITAVPCPRCQGTGESIEHPCADCGGEGRRTERRTLTVDIPAGVDEGSTLRLAGHGPAGFRGGPNGALFVHLSVRARRRSSSAPASTSTPRCTCP